MENIKKRLVLHIGTHKTGSTAIQNALYKFKGDLKQLGYFPIIPHFDYKYIHELFNPWSYQKRPEDINSEDVRKEFINDLSSIDEDQIIMSCEDFTAFFWPWSGNAEKLGDLVKDLFSEVVLIVYLRRQDTMYESGYQQQAKQGHTKLDFSDYVNDKYRTPYNKHLDWYAKVTEYATFFPNVSLKPRIYEHAVSRGDIFIDFCKTAGIENYPETFSSDFVNVSMPDIAKEVINECSGRLSDDDMSRLKMIFFNWFNLKEPTMYKRASYFNFDDRNKLIDYYHDSNMRLFKEFGLGDEADFYDWEDISAYDESISENDNAFIMLARMLISKHGA